MAKSVLAHTIKPTIRPTIKPTIRPLDEAAVVAPTVAPEFLTAPILLNPRSRTSNRTLNFTAGLLIGSAPITVSITSATVDGAPVPFAGMSADLPILTDDTTLELEFLATNGTAPDDTITLSVPILFDPDADVYHVEVISPPDGAFSSGFSEGFST